MIVFFLVLAAAAVSAGPLSTVTVTSSTGSTPTWLYVGFNGSAPGSQQLCRKVGILFSQASNVQTIDSCGQPFKFPRYPWTLAYFYLKNSTQPGDVTVPQSLLAPKSIMAQYTPLISYLTCSTDPWNTHGYLDSRPQGSLQLMQGNGWYTQIYFTFFSSTDCTQLLLDIDSDCLVSNGCSSTPPTVNVRSIAGNGGMCAINNYIDLDFDKAFAN
jgi:hypothetical protein